MERTHNGTPRTRYVHNGSVFKRGRGYFFGEGNFYIDKRQRTIPDHLHWHTRRRKEDVRPVWIQERMGVDEC